MDAPVESLGSHIQSRLGELHLNCGQPSEMPNLQENGSVFTWDAHANGAWHWRQTISQGQGSIC